MSELIVYEDSPLAQYLEEIDAAEGIIVEETTSQSAISNMSMVWSQQSKLKSFIIRLFTNNYSSYKLIALSLLETLINILGNSGLLADRYTPRPLTKAFIDNEFGDIQAATEIGSLQGKRYGRASDIAQLVVPSAIGGGIALKATTRGTRFFSALRIALLAGSVGCAGIALSSIFGQMRLDSAIKRVSGFRNRLLETVHICREIDSMIQRCIKNIQEIQFIYRGFRLPHYAGALNISALPGRGTLWMSSHLCQTTNEVLTRIAKAMLEMLDKEDGLSAD
ncbi:hypothetical protein FB639_003972, partial [Coemansia asiatica]